MKDMQLVYSPDDNGWYWQRYKDWKTSQIFRTELEALKAKEKNKLKWE